MKFVFLGYADEKMWNAMTDQERQSVIEECRAFEAVLRKGEHWTGVGEALAGSQTARTVKLKDGKLIVTDGPYAETKEQLGGFGVMEARDMEQAVEIASTHAGLRFGPTEVRPIDGATELVQRLAQDGFVVALASSGDPQFSREAVDLLGIEEAVDALMTSEDVDRSKPAPDLVEATMDRLGDLDGAIFVGDTVYDVEASARAGIPCIGVRSGGFGRAELEDAGADRVVDLVADLRDLDWTAEVSRPS